MAKAKDKQPKKKVGRKWFDGKNPEEVISKCKEIWMVKGTDAEAALFAEVSTASLSRFLEAHPTIKELRNNLRYHPRLAARRTIVDGLQDWNHAWAYMQKDAPEEFGDVPPTTVNNINIDFAAEARARSKKYADAKPRE